VFEKLRERVPSPVICQYDVAFETCSKATPLAQVAYRSLVLNRPLRFLRAGCARSRISPGECSRERQRCQRAARGCWQSTRSRSDRWKGSRHGAWPRLPGSYTHRPSKPGLDALPLLSPSGSAVNGDCSSTTIFILITSSSMDCRYYTTKDWNLSNAMQWDDRFHRYVEYRRLPTSLPDWSTCWVSMSHNLDM